MPVAAGGAGSLYTLATLGHSANIRIDLLLVVAAIFICNSIGLVVLVSVLVADRWRQTLDARARSASWVASVAIAVGLAAAGWSWVSVVRSNQLRTVQHLRGFDLLLEAKLRSHANAETAYGPLSTEDPRLAEWVGVWDLEPPAGRVRTVVITAEREAWIRFECGSRECEVGPGTLALEGRTAAAAVVPAMGGGTWELELELNETADGAEMHVAARQRSGSQELEAARARRRVLLDPVESAEAELEPLGAFSAVEWRGNHVALTEFRLWRRGGRLFGIAMCGKAVPGRSTFLQPKPFQAELLDGNRFALPLGACGRTGRLQVGAVEIVGHAAGDWGVDRALRMASGSLVPDVALDLVPAISVEAWKEWTTVVLPPLTEWTAPDRPEAEDAETPSAAAPAGGVKDLAVLGAAGGCTRPPSRGAV